MVQLNLWHSPLEKLGRRYYLPISDVEGFIQYNVHCTTSPQSIPQGGTHVPVPSSDHHPRSRGPIVADLCHRPAGSRRRAANQPAAGKGKPARLTWTPRRITHAVTAGQTIQLTATFT